MLKYTTISALVLSIAIISTNTASADGHKKFLATSVLSTNIVIMNGIMAPKKSYTNSGATASSGGYKKFLPTNVIGMNVITMNGIMAPKKSYTRTSKYKKVRIKGYASFIEMNGKMAPKKSYTKSRPTASAGGFKKAKFTRNFIEMNGIKMSGRKATRK